MTARRIVVCAALALAGPASADLLHVPDEYPTVQAAIDAAAHGDEIVVSPGAHATAADLMGKSITLRGTDPSDPAVVAATILDGGGAGPVIVCGRGEGRDTVVDGLTITGGAAVFGGGAYVTVASPTFRRCVFLGNEATYGGGMFVGYGSPAVVECTFRSNTAAAGGGLELYGGSTALVLSSRFEANRALDGSGGALCSEGSGPIIECCTFIGNEAPSGDGGAVFLSGPTPAVPTVANSVFVANSAGGSGGGLGNLHADGAVVASCTFVANAASGSPGGGGLACDATAAVANSIFRDNVGGEIVPAFLPVSSCIVRGGHAGTSVLDVDPLFVDGAPGPGADGVWGTADDDAGDYRLRAGSPAIDAGANSLLPADVADLDGDGDTSEPCPLDVLGLPRRHDDPGTVDTGEGAPPLVDIGACEFQGRTCIADTDGSGAVDVDDLVAVILDWGTDGSGRGGDVDGSGVVDNDDLIAVIVDWGECG